MGPARFQRQPTIMNLRELLVGRRGEAPLVPPYILSSFKKALALAKWWADSSTALIASRSTRQ